LASKKPRSFDSVAWDGIYKFGLKIAKKSFPTNLQNIHALFQFVFHLPKLPNNHILYRCIIDLSYKEVCLFDKINLIT